MNNDQIIFATGNTNKIAEISRIYPMYSFIGLEDIGISEDIPETGDTFHENAEQKARYIWDRRQKPVFAEDSGLEVEALEMKPGVFSARYAGNEKSHDSNMDKVLSELKDSDQRKARFTTVVCFIDTNGDSHFFTGHCPGEISHVKIGKNGFGYDPIFIPEGFQKTFGQLDHSIKDAISHRKKALEGFIEFLRCNS